MQTLFELKTNMPFDADIFERMKKTASDLLRNTEKEQYTQAIVLLSKKGNEYGTIIRNVLSEDKTEESALLEGLRAADDTEICYILCMWGDACIDIPSFAFRARLCTANPQNTESKIFVMTQNGVSVMKLANTMK